MMMELANSFAHVDDSKNLRNVHIINNSGTSKNYQGEKREKKS